jgi:5-methylcytosine-specific restriction endonuclease McrA
MRVNLKQCIICGIQFELLTTQNPKRTTCSPDCFKELMRRKQMGPNNSYWRGGHSQAHYERIRKLIKPNSCEKCGADGGGVRLDTHHKDRNKANNEPWNIMVLCAKCHAYLHYLEDDRGLRGWKKKN